MLYREVVFVGSALVATASAAHLHLHELLLSRDFHFDVLGRDGGGPVAVVQDANNYCTYLPSNPGTSISDGETDAQPFCVGSPQDGSDIKTMPSNFILSSHFVQTDSYVQVTGCVDPTKYGLNPVTDGGGQYDNAGSPPGATCAGYPAFVNLVEPTNARFCIRCCKSQDDCNVSISTYGCDHIIPGDYTANGQDCMSAFNAAKQANTSPTAPAIPSPSNSTFLVNSNSTSNSTTSSNSTSSSTSSSSTSSSASASTTATVISSADLLSASVSSFVVAFGVAIMGF